MKIAEEQLWTENTRITKVFTASTYKLHQGIRAATSYIKGATPCCGEETSNQVKGASNHVEGASNHVEVAVLRLLKTGKAIATISVKTTTGTAKTTAVE